MTSTKRWYDVNGVVVSIEAQNEDHFSILETYLHPFGGLGPRTADFSVFIAQGVPCPPPVAADVLQASEIAPGVPGTLAIQADKIWMLASGELSVASCLRSRTATMRLLEGCSRAAIGAAGIHIMDTILAAFGCHMLHGAALSLPDNDARAILIFAPSGAGKTTTALALALNGFGLMTDDAIVFEPQGYRQSRSGSAWGLPRPLKVHRRTAKMLPAVAPLLDGEWNSEDERSLRLDQLTHVANVASHTPREIAALFILSNRSPTTHVISRLGRAEAMLQVVTDNVTRGPAGLPSLQISRFEALGQLLATVPIFQLSAGKSLEAIPEALAAALRDAGPTI